MPPGDWLLGCWLRSPPGKGPTHGRNRAHRPPSPRCRTPSFPPDRAFPSGHMAKGKSVRNAERDLMELGALVLRALRAPGQSTASSAGTRTWSRARIERSRSLHQSVAWTQIRVVSTMGSSHQVRRRISCHVDDYMLGLRSVMLEMRDRRPTRPCFVAPVPHSRGSSGQYVSRSCSRKMSIQYRHPPGSRSRSSHRSLRVLPCAAEFRSDATRATRAEVARTSAQPGHMKHYLNTITPMLPTLHTQSCMIQV